jgi:hypothetical protein
MRNIIEMRYVVEHTLLMVLAAPDDLMPMARVCEVNGIMEEVAPESTSPLVATRR